MNLDTILRLMVAAILCLATRTVADADDEAAPEGAKETRSYSAKYTVTYNTGYGAPLVVGPPLAPAPPLAYNGTGPGYGHAHGHGYHHNHSYASPWAVLPGHYPKHVYGGPMYYLGHKYNPQSIYYSYLASGYYESYSAACSKYYGQPAKLSKKDLDAAFAYALYELKKYEALEKQNHLAGHYLNASVYSSAARHQIGAYLNKLDPMYIKEKEALFMEYASKYLIKYNCLSKLDGTLWLPTVKIVAPSLKNPYGGYTCNSVYYNKGQSLKCNLYDKYRTIDGSCNNWKHPYWGKSYVCHLRLVPSAYDDGLSSPRVYSYSGKYLPGARVISTVAHNDVHDRAYYTHMKAAWGQYINHDITNTPNAQAEYSGLIKCCPKPYHPQCMPIHIPAYGDYQNKYKRTCMNFVRSAPCPLCTLGPRQQINVGTSFLDSSALYGSTPDVAKRLRSYKLGYLRVGKDKYGRDILPPTNHPWLDQCSAPYKNMLCFDSGDVRVSQHPNLQLLHTLWLRRHNHHAKHLYYVNPKWDDERLFQEARRLVIAELQIITYNEYLNILFGPTLMKYYSLDVLGPGYTYYEPYTDPTTWNDYATAACRFGHSQINSWQSLPGAYGPYNKTKGFWLHDWFFDPALIYDGQIDPMIRGLITDLSQTMDPWLAHSVTNYLYKAKYEKYGSDLAAFNIQRGRDHGIPPYHVYLEFCFGFKAYSWDDLGKFIPYEQLKYLIQLYGDWRDVDFWTGGISEKKFPDADVGPTFACVLGIQYYHLKFGDRFFATHGYQAGSFKPAQLANLRKTATLASFLCKTSDYLTQIQKHAFFPVAGYNPLVPCKSLPEVDYALWKEVY